MTSPTNSTATFELQVGSAKFSASGPQEWVDSQVATMLETAVFRLDHPVTEATKGCQITEVTEAQLPPHAMRWLQHHGVAIEALQRVIHLDGDRAEVIASALPGKGRERVMAAYLLEGLATYLTDESRRFADNSARQLLEKHGAYDKNNHAVYMKQLRNILVGGKKDGWTLTIPGQVEAAKLVKTLGADVAANVP